LQKYISNRKSNLGFDWRVQASTYTTEDKRMYVLVDKDESYVDIMKASYISE